VRVVCYAQHLSGVGHFVRMHALACGLSRRHEVHLVDGGRPVPLAPDPPALRRIALPPLARSGGELIALDGDAPVAERLAERAAALSREVERIRPDTVLIDHYPFSKWELEGEIAAAIDAARGCNARARIFCSLRDVVRQTRYEKADRGAYDERVVAALASRFDGVLIHADPRFTRLEEHFAPARDLPVPVAYTGFVVHPAPAPINLEPRPFAVLSCGGGAGALAFLLAAIEAYRSLGAEAEATPLLVFPGGSASADECEALAAAAGNVRVRPFGPEFGAVLEAATLSISRAGYNTCAALLRSRTRAVLVPDPAMSDQTFRARRFADLGLAQTVEGDPPPVEALAAAMRAALAGPPPRHDLDLDGAARSEASIAAALRPAAPRQAP
jgi:predicted glycosyltransferase